MKMNQKNVFACVSGMLLVTLLVVGCGLEAKLIGKHGGGTSGSTSAASSCTLPQAKLPEGSIKDLGQSPSEAYSKAFYKEMVRQASWAYRHWLCAGKDNCTCYDNDNWSLEHDRNVSAILADRGSRAFSILDTNVIDMIKSDPWFKGYAGNRDPVAVIKEDLTHYIRFDYINL